MMDRGTELALKRAVREGLATRLQGDFDPVEVESAIQSLVQEAVRAWNLGLAEPDVARLCRSVGDDFLRYGPLQGLLEDPGITEIIVNGGGVAMDAGVARFLEPHVFVERAGRLEPCPYVRFDDADHLRRIIDKIAEQAGMRCDEAHAMGCAMLPGGKARATYIVPPLAPDGPALNLRLFGDDVMSIEDLTARGALSPVMAEFLGSAVRARCPVIISGGTGSGKTTMLGALSGFIPDDERVLTIEDTPELRLRAAHVERMQTREANTEGEGAVGMRELVALSLRRRPDRIIVGECRGAEAYEMLQAMQTDHPGSMTTVHANDPGNALSRLRTMVGYANADLGRDVIVQQIAESLAGGLIVHVERMRDGGRRVTSIVAVDQMPEGATVIPRAELFRFEPRGMDAFSRITGAWRACGVQPQRIKQRLLAAGQSGLHRRKLRCTALSLRLRQRAEENDARASDRALYELGKRDAESAKADVEGPLGRMLRDAGIEASPVSWTLCLGTVGAFAAFFGMRASGLLGAMLGVGLVCIAAALYVLRARAKRRELLSRQFVRLVPQLSASVKSSLTLERALRVSADHAPEPLRSELMAVLARVSYGMPLVQALARMAQSTGDADVAALASAMRIQQRFGGSMGAVLDLIAEHAQGRALMQQELRSELAGTRMATVVVACAMPAIFAFMFATNPAFSLFYRENPLGWAVLAGAALMEVAGIAACRRITRFSY